MEFKHIEYFIESSKHTSMSKAAEALYISQQALSRCIANMEQELGVKLFHRSVKGIRLTKDGEYFYQVFAPQVQQFHQTLNETIAHFQSRPVDLPFCCAPLIFRCLDLELLFDFQEEYPNITLRRLEMPDADCESYVKENPEHFGMLAVPEEWHGKHFDFSLVKTFPLNLFVSRDNPLAQNTKIDFGLLKDEKFLTLDEKSYYSMVLTHYADKYGFKPKVIFASSDADQLIYLVQAGRGIAIGLAPLLDNAGYDNIAVIPFTDKDITWSIAFIYRDYEKLSVSAKKFMEYMIENV